MKKRLIFLFFLLQLLVLAVFNTTNIAQTAKSSQPADRIQIKTETQPFGYEVSTILRNYLGHSYADLYRALINREKVVARGEYESSIDYHARIAKLNEKPLVGTTNYNSRFAFTFLPNSEQFVMNYDPDMKALDIAVKWTQSYDFGGYSDQIYSLTWSESSRKVGSYIGRNAFNRSVRVSVYRNDSFYLITEFRNLQRVGTFREGASFVASIPMNTNDARSAKLNLRTLVTGRLADKSIFDNQSHETPEITDPYDRHNFDYAINLVVEEIWIYDYPTGKVLLRFGVSGAQNKKASPISVETSPTPVDKSDTPDGVTQEVKIISKPRPGYTDSARQANIEGTVILRVVFLASGQIGSISAVKGLPNGLTEQAIAAARRISFEPAKKNGVGQTVTKQIEYPFSILGNPPR